MAVLDTTPIPQAMQKNSAPAVVPVPDGCAAVRVCPIVDPTDWANGVGYSSQITVNGITNVSTFAHDPSLEKDGSPQIPKVMIGFDQPLVGAQATLQVGAAQPSNVGCRITAAPVAAQLPAPLPAPTTVQVAP